MKSTLKTLGLAALISGILVLPFVILEAVNQTITKQNVAGLALMFGILWLLPTVFIVILAPLVRNIKAGNAMTKPVALLLRVASLAVITMMWTGMVIDQLPCFLGIPNCD
jgi:hypothetical protein